MRLPYGFLKGMLSGEVWLKPLQRPNETQYHLHVSMPIDGRDYDIAINIGTNDDDDSLQYKLVFDFQNKILDTLKQADAGANDLTDADAAPALDFQRGDILTNTGDWRRSEPMDGSDTVEPAASVKKMLQAAVDAGSTVYVFGRFYQGGDFGVHDIHMNQGSTGRHFANPGLEAQHRSDGNDVWQDGGLFVDRGDRGFAAFFARFTQQKTPTDDLGNPRN